MCTRAITNTSRNLNLFAMFYNLQFNHKLQTKLKVDDNDTQNTKIEIIQPTCTFIPFTNSKQSHLLNLYIKTNTHLKPNYQRSTNLTLNFETYPPFQTEMFFWSVWKTLKISQAYGHSYSNLERVAMFLISRCAKWRIKIHLYFHVLNFS